MIIILCDDFESAKYCFRFFLDILQKEEGPGYVTDYDPYAYYIDTEDDLRYIFVDYRYESVFENLTLDILDEHTFFESIAEWYEEYYD